MCLGPHLLAVSLLLLPALSQAVAQDFPSRPIRMIVGFSAGGGNDAVARIVAAKLTDRLGRQVVVENRAGASGIVASEMVAAAPPDGHTLMLVSIAHAANPSLYKLKYDTERAFTPVAQVAAGPSVLVAYPGIAARNLGELLDHARKSPASIHFAHSGIGTYAFMAAAQLLAMTNVDIVMVAYKGGGAAQIDVLAGHAQLTISSPVQMSSYVKSGRFRALGITSARRLDAYPDVPAIAETVPGYEADNWWGIVGPAGIPKEVVNRLTMELVAVQAADDLQKVLESEGARAVKRTGAEFGTYISSEIAKWAAVAKHAKIKPD